jgi:hypothetical protein
MVLLDFSMTPIGKGESVSARAHPCNFLGCLGNPAKGE